MKKGIHIPALVVSVVLFCFLLYYPIFEKRETQRAFALFAMVAVLWMTEAIPLALTGLLIPVIATFLGLVPSKEAFAQFAHPIIFLFLGGFVLAAALTRHSLDKLLAKRLIRLAKGNFYRSSILLMLATSLLSCLVSNTSTTVMMLPIGMGMLALVNKKAVSSESKFLMLGIAYSANIGGVVTLVGSPPNALGAALLGISFSEWLKYGVFVFLFTFPVMAWVITWYFKPDKKLEIGAFEEVPAGDIPVKALGAIFIVTISLWLLEAVLSPLLGVADSFSTLVAIVAVFLIVITRVLNWEEVVKSVQWEMLLLFGGGLTLGMVLDRSGLGALLAEEISHFVTTMPLIAFLWVIVFTSILLTEFMSNTASAALLLPVLFTLAQKIEVNPVLLVLPATIAATYGFMLPVGTPPNALVFSSGLVPQRDMIKVGFILNVLFSVILTVFFYFLFRA